MSAQGTLLVGTVGQGVFRTVDDGETWLRAGPAQGIHSDCITRCLVSHASQPQTIYGGTDRGLYKSEDGGATWQLLESPMKLQTVWSLAIDPTQPSHLIAGVGTPSRAAYFHSEDSGQSWQAGSAEIAETCPAVGVPRPTAIAIDPHDSRSVWTGIEVDGVRHSNDGGATWQKAAPQIANPDVHNVLITSGRQKRIFVLVNDDVWISQDEGESWNNVGVRENFPLRYPRGITARPDDQDVVFVAIGDTTPGRTGALMRTTDAGKTWERLPLPVEPNSAMWTVHVARSNPDLMFAASRHGYIYRSENGGESWTKLWREFGEISSLAWFAAD